MAYNVKLEERIDAAIKKWKDVQKKKMFGGVCYLLRGNMAFGILRDCLIVRLDRAQAEQSLRHRNVKPFDVTGRPLAGWIMVQEAGWSVRASLEKWIDAGKKFALSLPEKKAKNKAKKKSLREYRG